MIRYAACILAFNIAALPALGSGGADENISLASLGEGERIEISYDSQGCFSPNQAELSFTSDGVEISELNGRANIPGFEDLSSDKLAKMDRYLQLLKKGELGGECSTIETYAVQIWKHNKLVNAYSAIDGSCAAEEDAEVYSPGVLVSEVENEAARQARARMMGR